MERKRLSVDVSPELHGAVAVRAKSLGVSMSDVVRVAVGSFVERSGAVVEPRVESRSSGLVVEAVEAGPVVFEAELVGEIVEGGCRHESMRKLPYGTWCEACGVKVR